MGNKPVLDVIVPSYKTSSFVKNYGKTLYSSPLEGKVRFLLVDDGSPDDTYSEIAKISSAHPLYFLPFTKTNGGHGSVINFGIQHVEAPFFCVMDGDDFLNLNELLRLVDFLGKNEDADAVVCDFSDVDILSGTCTLRTLDLKEGPLMIKESVPKDPSVYDMPFLLARTFYRTSLWAEHGLAVVEGVYYDDCFYNVCALPFVKKAYYLHLNVYQYRHFSSAGDEQSTTIRSIAQHSQDMLMVVNQMFHLLNSIDPEADCFRYITVYLASICWRLYLYLLIGFAPSKQREAQLRDLDRDVKGAGPLNAFIKKKKAVLFYRLFARHFFRIGSMIARKKVGL